MAVRCCRRSAFVVLLLTLLTCQVFAQSCNTNQNPHCAGNNAFEKLCCPYPAVCYWANRYGAVGCCQPGQVCIGNGATITPTLYQTIYSTAGPTPQPIPQTQPAQNGGYSTVTITGGVAGATVATAAGYTTTAGVIVANDGGRARGFKHALQLSMALATSAWIMI